MRCRHACRCCRSSMWQPASKRVHSFRHRQLHLHGPANPHFTVESEADNTDVHIERWFAIAEVANPPSEPGGFVKTRNAVIDGEHRPSSARDGRCSPSSASSHDLFAELP